MRITKGDTHKFDVTVKDSDDNIFNLTGYTMLFTAKASLTQDTDDIASTAVISDPTTGIGSFTLLPTDTNIDSGTYYFDIKITDGGNNVYTVIDNDELIISP